ncbi:hypothetical protein KIPB_002235 [Kipferlia bialata]|uniref:Uncharacterized protein n=1 Tax=Kipferlia bialata TaxID=797122 RepID=A0A9K3CSE0_9EUKA|nr:hypothetical protein KIPB_002235 [Kipferlia bialata]|eukprot:g2235.t1
MRPEGTAGLPYRSVQSGYGVVAGVDSTGHGLSLFGTQNLTALLSYTYPLSVPPSLGYTHPPFMHLSLPSREISHVSIVSGGSLSDPSHCGDPDLLDTPPEGVKVLMGLRVGATEPVAPDSGRPPPAQPDLLMLLDASAKKGLWRVEVPRKKRKGVSMSMGMGMGMGRRGRQGRDSGAPGDLQGIVYIPPHPTSRGCECVVVLVDGCLWTVSLGDGSAIHCLSLPSIVKGIRPYYTQTEGGAAVCGVVFDDTRGKVGVAVIETEQMHQASEAKGRAGGVGMGVRRNVVSSEPSSTYPRLRVSHYVPTATPSLNHCTLLDYASTATGDCVLLTHHAEGGDVCDIWMHRTARCDTPNPTPHRMGGTDPTDSLVSQSLVLIGPRLSLTQRPGPGRYLALTPHTVCVVDSARVTCVPILPRVPVGVTGPMRTLLHTALDHDLKTPPGRTFLLKARSTAATLTDGVRDTLVGGHTPEAVVRMLSGCGVETASQGTPSTLTGDLQSAIVLQTVRALKRVKPSHIEEAEDSVRDADPVDVDMTNATEGDSELDRLDALLTEGEREREDSPRAGARVLPPRLTDTGVLVGNGRALRQRQRERDPSHRVGTCLVSSLTPRHILNRVYGGVETTKEAEVEAEAGGDPAQRPIDTHCVPIGGVDCTVLTLPCDHKAYSHTCLVVSTPEGLVLMPRFGC